MGPIAARLKWIRLGPCLLVPLLYATAHASIYRVGSDPACTHATLEAAIATAEANGAEIDEIRLPAGALDPLSAPLLIDGHSLLLWGGFADCSATAPTARTSVTGPAGVLRVHGDTATPVEVTVRGMDFTAQNRRVLDLDSVATLRLDDTSVIGGWAGPQDDAQFGGGVRVQGADATLILGGNARVSGNRAIAGGGGYCRGGHVYLEHGSSIDSNLSEGQGGGVYLDGCTFTDASGGAARPGGGYFGITDNTATGNGGGVYAANGAMLEILGTDDLTLIAGNTANNGAGLYLAGAGSAAELVNTAIEGNQASGVGGGLYVRDRASLEMGRYSVDCPGEIFCSRLRENRATRGSAVAADGVAQVKVLQTDIRHNPVSGSAGGAAIDARGENDATTPPTPTLVLLESVVLFDHAPAPASYAEAGALVRAAYVSTLSNGSAIALGEGGHAHLFSSVVQDAVFVMPPSGNATRFVDCVTAKEIASIPPEFDGIEALDDPAALYKSPSTGDLRQRPRARSIDRCDTFFYAPTTRDIFGFLRGLDVPSVQWSPSFGPIDQGAMEAPWLFADDFDP